MLEWKFYWITNINSSRYFIIKKYKIQIKERFAIWENFHRFWLTEQKLLLSNQNFKIQDMTSVAKFGDMTTTIKTQKLTLNGFPVYIYSNGIDKLNFKLK